MLPIKKWSQPLRVRDVAIDGNRPPGNSGMVYVVTGQPAAERDVKYLGSAHATKATDGAGRIGLLIIAMLGFPVYHSGGICLHKKYSADQIKDFYVLWALIDDDSCARFLLSERSATTT